MSFPFRFLLKHRLFFFKEHNISYLFVAREILRGQSDPKFAIMTTKPKSRVVGSTTKTVVPVVAVVLGSFLSGQFRGCHRAQHI
jgi:hypothetical protein